MIDKRGLQSKHYPVTAVEADLVATGEAATSVVPANMRRYIYRVKVQDDSAAPNLVELKKQILPAAAEVVDQFRLVLASESYVDPDELKEDALPLYILEAGCHMRAVGTGVASMLLEYEDSE